MKPATVSLLFRLRQEEFFSDLNYQFGRFIEKISQGSPERMGLLAAFASRQNEAGHICLRLDSIAGFAGDIEEPGLKEDFSGLKDVDWKSVAEQSGLCATSMAAGVTPLPFVLTPDNRFYLARYWDYEERLAKAVRTRLSVRPDVMVGNIREPLESLFPTGAVQPDWQKIAAVAVAENSFAIVSGGPGTGKTTTIARILAILLAASGKPLKIALTAPTGKAAMRAQEAVAAAVSEPYFKDVPVEIKERILKAGAFTLHRLLGFQTGSPFFRHNAENPLDYDIVIADESSMIPVALMTKLIEAVRPGARLVLLGDQDQLSSVEAGAVFGDLCSPGQCGISPAFNGNVIVLRHSYRFSRTPLLGRVIAAINAGDAADCIGQVKDATSPVRLLGTGENGGLKALVESNLENGLGEYLKTLPEIMNDPLPALAAFGKFRILCARHTGTSGVTAVNALAERWFLRKTGTGGRGGFYTGRPILITENSYDTDLFNGDAGIALGDGHVVFPARDRGFRKVSVGRLPAHATLFAMTIHKSQGSEFDRVLVLLPAEDSPLLTRELIYTAVSRARIECLIRADDKIFKAAVERPTQRNSGLRQAVWGKTE